jgi:hypothetical protein
LIITAYSQRLEQNFHIVHESSFEPNQSEASHETDTNLSNITETETNVSIETNLTTNTPPIISNEQVIYLSYKEIPKSVFVGEIYAIKIEAIIAESDFDGFQTEFIGGNDTEVINPKSNWKWFSDNIFYNTFYLKSNNALATLPDTRFSLLSDSNITYSKTIEGQDIQIHPLIENNLYCGVLAKELQVKNSSVSHFDDSSNIVVLEMESNYGNLLDFQIQNVLRQGIESSTINFPHSKIYYFAIIPKAQKKFSFAFFNLTSNNYEELFVPIIIDNQNVSTQTDINPKKSRYELYKSLIIASFAAVLFVLFLLRRKKIYLWGAIAIALYLFLFRSTFNEVVIKPNSNIQILPTKNSTIFFTTQNPTYCEKLFESKNYIKVILPNTQIGWVKKDRIEKN